jgi:hypothetical protein
MMSRSAWLVLLSLAVPGAAAAQTKLLPEDAPTFQLRARVVAQGSQAPAGKKFTFRLSGPGNPVSTTGDGWSDWLKFGREQVEATLKGYPAVYLRGYPVVVILQVEGVVDPTRVEAELKFDEGGDPTKLAGELFGPNFGILLWREDKKPRAATMAEYNRRYWKALEGVRIPEAERPRHFPVVDRFIGGDDDRLNWQEGVEQLASAGYSVLMLPPSKLFRDILLKAGLRRTAWAVYNPPGYAFALDPKVTPDAITAWAEDQAKPYRDAGYTGTDMALFAMSDEPGWYYPKQLQELAQSPAGLARFRDYLKAQGLQPADVGAKGWDEVLPVGRSRATDLPARRLFYWTARFCSYDSAQHFADCTRALEKAFAPGTPVLTNWNFFSGRLYVPGPVANNADKDSPDAAMGGHDWLEFGRLRGGTMLWTEDWFGDDCAYQWSFYCAKLRCAAAKGQVQFGGYVVPRAGGDREDGLLQKVLCVVGSGGKAVKYYVFGPEYTFPGNCYSESAKVLTKVVEAHRLLGAAEQLLWPGKRPRPEVAILAPRSAQLWDAKGMRIAKGISDATNTHLNRETVDYLAEVFDLYLALQHANIPADFVEEEDLSAEGLKPYKVLYVTEPNVPEEGQRGLAAWVKGGGTLVTVSGAGARDRYDEPCDILAELGGVREQSRERLLVADAKELKAVGEGKGICGAFTAVGVRGVVKEHQGDIVGEFADGAPAVLRRSTGKGRVVHFAFLPGLGYWKSAAATKDRLPAGFSESQRRWVVWPAELAGVKPPVVTDRPLVEAPLLLSEQGAAMTLLNWTGERLEKVDVTAHVPFAVRTVRSVKQGPLTFEKAEGGVRFALPLGAADVVLLRP